MRITLDRPPEQIKRGDYARFFPGVSVREGAEVEIVRGQIARRPLTGSEDLGGLQCRLDYASNADSHLVLKLEYIFQRAIEPVGPKMCTADGINQLPGDANSSARLAD
jgi:hypothetical protein